MRTPFTRVASFLAIVLSAASLLGACSSSAKPGEDSQPRPASCDAGKELVCNGDKANPNVQCQCLTSCSPSTRGACTEAECCGTLQDSTGSWCVAKNTHACMIELDAASDAKSDGGSCKTSSDCSAGLYCEYEAGCGRTQGTCHDQSCAALPSITNYCGCDGSARRVTSACGPSEAFASLGACPDGGQ